MSTEPTQAELDNTQYSLESIRLYESVFGEDFVSPGGHAMAVELITQLQQQPGSRVLDVGCGLGGSAFVMAAEFGLKAEGIDLSKNMLSIAQQKSRDYGLDDSVTFELGDCLLLDRVDQYDAIYSRDVFLHIHDKSRLFSVLYAALKPGGKILFTDYCCGDKPWRPAFSDYVRARSYCLHTVTEYAGLIEQGGFAEVEKTDLTGRFVEILHDDLATIETLELPPSTRHELRQSWLGKLERAESGDHRWGLFSAFKL